MSHKTHDMHLVCTCMQVAWRCVWPFPGSDLQRLSDSASRHRLLCYRRKSGVEQLLTGLDAPKSGSCATEGLSAKAVGDDMETTYQTVHITWTGCLCEEMGMEDVRYCSLSPISPSLVPAACRERLALGPGSSFLFGSLPWSPKAALPNIEPAAPAPLLLLPPSS